MIDWTPILTQLIVGILGGGTLTTGIALAWLHSRKGDDGSKRAQEEVLKETTLPMAPVSPAPRHTDEALLRSLEAHMARQDEDMSTIRAELAAAKLELAGALRRLSEVEHDLSHVRRNYNRLHQRALRVVINWATIRRSETPPKLLDDLDPPE